MELMGIDRYVLHNDQIREASDPMLSPGQVGLLAGWGVFSTIRMADGIPFAFEYHWARLEHDAKLMAIPMPPKPDAVRQKLTELTEANASPDCTLRLVVVRNGGGQPWEGPAGGRSYDLIALTTGLKNWGSGVKLTWREHGRHAANPFSRAKILSWSMNLTFLEEAQKAGFDEVILLNERGEVSECTSANIFIREGDKFWTPPLSSGCLPGITRHLLLNDVKVPGLQVREKTLFLPDLDKADEVFITSTTRGLLPVLSVNGTRMNSKSAGHPALQAALTQYFNEYVASRKEVRV